MLILMLLIGLVAGALSGVVGIGGGIIIVPALVYLAHMDQRRAQGTSLGVLLIPAGIFAFMEYYRAGQVDLKIVALVCGGFLIGGYFGGMLAQHLPEAVLRRIFAGLMIVVGVRMLWGK
jgi:uncharacterized membrane protein YfcA